MSALTVGSQYRFLATITKDGSVWDLTGATVRVHFKKPDGTTFSAAASIFNAAAGQVSYDCSTSDLSVAGNWTRCWQITLGGLTNLTNPTGFVVENAP